RDLLAAGLAEDEPAGARGGRHLRRSGRRAVGSRTAAQHAARAFPRPGLEQARHLPPRDDAPTREVAGLQAVRVPEPAPERVRTAEDALEVHLVAAEEVEATPLVQAVDRPLNE